MIDKFHEVEINENGVVLDGVQLKGVTGYRLSDEGQVSSLTVTMDVCVTGRDVDAAVNEVPAEATVVGSVVNDNKDKGKTRDVLILSVVAVVISIVTLIVKIMK